MTFCNHLFVDGFGGMGDALVCCRCGLDRYPEAIPVQVLFATLQRRIVRAEHPEYVAFCQQAREARSRAEERENK